ncbi:hypothetical protein F2P56_034894 [Juglans regia]|uniref:ABC-type xenobiotic transporter n=1 Tax=Juglans regia TaxID=51240 RepID=A0A833WRR5_JUGRE|nr:hypothetical protein F2P56_034894 [Juglans regia]
MEYSWDIFCGESGCSDSVGRPCSFNFQLLSHSSSCINHIFIICLDVLLLVMLLLNMLHKSPLKTVHIRARFEGFSNLQIVSSIVNGCLGFGYSCLGIWILEEKLRKTKTALPLNWWLLIMVQGITWLLVSLTVSLWRYKFPRGPLRLLSILAFLFVGIVCSFSLSGAILNKEVSIKVALDILSFPGAILLLFCTFKGYKYETSDESINESPLYMPLNGEAIGISKSDVVGSVTLFAKAGLFSRISFWWLNPLMKRGREKTLEDEDIPNLCEADRAESCYLVFLEQLNKLKQKEPSSQPSVLRTIIVCHWKEILMSGFFALLKIITLSMGPLLLNAFILVAEGKESFKYEGYVLAIMLFFSKSIESISQRQWYFRSRLIGLKVRSLLTASIYKKQLRLSNAARLVHSGGEIMNYVTVDVYRIGEFPFWFHQTWTTSLQLCIALVILFRAVGLATIAALVVIILTVLCNSPLAKLQHQFQRKLMVAQDERLKASTEALVNMNVLKLYAWETHFKRVIENLRKEEYNWLSAVQMLKSYNGFLFSISPILVSAATFGACYFLKVPLYANNIFTFVASLLLIQDPIRSIPDVIGVVIQAKVAFSRILKFLEAPEMQSASVRTKTNVETVNHTILINSANFSWEENLPKPTLRNINLEIGPGEKVAICGEVGSGKSTLLAAILGEVPNIQGTIQVYGKIAYVSQTSWIQTGTIQENILFGSDMDNQKYKETLEMCSLVKDLELLPYGDLTEIGERGVNLSGGQKQRIQLARALYQNGDIYLLDDPFSAVDAQTASSLFNEYVMKALSRKTVLLVTHQVDFLTAFHSVLVSSDLSIVDLDVPSSFLYAVGATINAYANLGVLAVVTWQVLFVTIPMVYLAICLQRYYFSSAKELMRINGTTKSLVANHLAESVAGAMTIRAFEEEDRFFAKTFNLIDTNASPFFHNFAANEWLIQRLETISAIFLASAALCMVLLPPGTFSSGFIGMTISYGLSLNMFFVFSIQNQCTLANYIISVERVNQYMHIPNEAPEVIEGSRPPTNWPSLGKVEILDLQIRYRPDTPLVLHGISCTFEGGQKIGIVGRTGSGKTTLIGALFRLVEPEGGKIIVDGIDISTIGLHDLRSRFGIIPQDPTLFNGTMRYNLDPLSQHSEKEIWEVLEKCQLQEAVKEKKKGLDSVVVEDGSNWSQGQRQLFCLGRALLRRSRILVLDEATASIDNATDMILQKTIRTEFSNCTVITVAHRIPTVMDCGMVLSISDGKLVEFDEPTKLMKREGSLFGQLVSEYWSHNQSTEPN